MKKLMIAAAIVCAAAFAQAGFVTWGCTNVKDAEGNGLTAGHMYAFFYGTQKAADDALAKFVGEDVSMTTENFKKLIGDANWNDSKKATSAGMFTIGTVSSLGGYTKAALDNSEFGLTGGNTYYGFLVITDTDTVTDDTNYIATGIKSQKTAGDGATTGASFAFGSQAANTTWNAVNAVPEPTTGLLVLMGLAGLALKRRRA